MNPFKPLLLIGMCMILGQASGEDAAKGNLRYSITVSKFENKANWSGQWNLGDAWGSVMTDALQGSGRFIVLGESDMRAEAMAEQDRVDSGRMAGGNKAPKKGNMTPAQLLVKGDITHVQNSTTGGGAGIGFRGIRLGGSTDKAEINATIYLVDSRTGQVKASTKVVGKAGKKGLGVGYSGSALGGLTGEFDGFKKDNVGKATEDAIAQAVDFLIKQLESIPWEATVVSAKDGKVIINRGTREGVSEGQAFIVGELDETVDPDTGEVLDRSVKEIATIRVTGVKEKIATCQASTGGDKVVKGMTVLQSK